MSSSFQSLRMFRFRFLSVIFLLFTLFFAANGRLDPTISLLASEKSRAQRHQQQQHRLLRNVVKQLDANEDDQNPLEDGIFSSSDGDGSAADSETGLDDQNQSTGALGTDDASSGDNGEVTIQSDGGTASDVDDRIDSDGGSGTSEFHADSNAEPSAQSQEQQNQDERPPTGDGEPVDEKSTGDGSEEHPASEEPQPRSDDGVEHSSSEAEISKNETAAFEAFKLLQMVESDNENAFNLVPVFEQGSLTGPFVDSPNTSDVSEVLNRDDQGWYTESPYADRIAFQFTYEPESTDYKVAEPVLQSDVSSETGPIMQDFHNDPSTGIGSLTVLYKCERDGPEKYYVAMKLRVTENYYIEATWIKRCGRGRFEHLEFGFKSHDNSVTLFNSDSTYGTVEQKTLEVGPIESSTVLVMKLVPPAHNARFLDPTISSDSGDVGVSLRGTIAGATFNSDTETSFTILYDCKAATTSQVRFSVGLPPWDNVTAHWRKDCGGSSSQALLIGTTGGSSFDVMQDGELASRYNVTDETSLDEAVGRVEAIPQQVQSKRFYITNSDDTSDIHIQTISATMSNPDILTTFVSTPLIATSYIPASGDVVHREETKSLFLRFACKKEGKSLVLVTLPTLRYKNVEFGFIKECSEPRVYHSSGFLQTASSLMAAFFVVGILGGVGAWIYIRRRQGAKYTAVPTRESMIP